MQVTGQPGRYFTFPVQLDTPLRRVPVDHEAVFFRRERDVVSPRHGGTLLVAVTSDVDTSGIAPEDPSAFEVEASVVHVPRSGEANTRTCNHALERREGRVARFPARRQGFLLGLLFINFGLRGRAGAHRAGAARVY